MTVELTDDEYEKVRRAIETLMANERDRELGYPSDELATPPKLALKRGDLALEALGEDPEQVIWEEDRERLGLQR